MKGLLKNDFLAVYTNAKIFSVFVLLFGIFSLIVSSQSLQMYFVLIGIVGFSINTAAVLNNEYASKWGKYKISLPVKRADIIKSQFINYLLWLLVSVLFTGTGTGLSWLFHGCPFENYTDILSIFAMGISISLFAGALFIPLFYSGNEEKGTVFLIIALLCAVGITALLLNITNENLLLGIITILLSSSLAFALSYPLTVKIFWKREY